MIKPKPLDRFERKQRRVKNSGRCTDCLTWGNPERLAEFKDHFGIEAFCETCKDSYYRKEVKP